MIRPNVIVGLMGNVISILVYAAPMGLFWEVVKKKSSENYDVLPYITTLLCKSLWTSYGVLDPNGLPLVMVNGLGVLSESIYVILYLIYAPKDKMVKTLVLVTILNVVFVGSVITVAILVFHKECSQRIFMGVLCATVNIVMYAAPLKAMRLVIKTKSVEFMSLALSFMLLLNTGCWFTYALTLRDSYVMVPNAIGMLSSSSQIILCMIYRNKSPLITNSAVMDEETGSIDHAAKGEGPIEMQNFDETKTENNPSLTRGNSLPNLSLSRQYSIQKIMRSLSANPYRC